MAFVFGCPSCGKQRKAPAEYAGRKVRCTDCSHEFRIPALRPKKTAPPAPVVREPLDLGSADLFSGPAADPLAMSAVSAPLATARPMAASHDAMDPQTAKILVGSMCVAGVMLFLLSAMILSSIFRSGGSVAENSSTVAAAAFSSEAPSTASPAVSPISAPAQESEPASRLAATSPAPVENFAASSSEAIETASSIAATQVSSATPESSTAAGPSYPASTEPQTPQAENPDRNVQPAPTTVAAQEGSTTVRADGADGQTEPVDPNSWLQDFELAKRRAAAQGKDILLVFSGSDWCGWSIRLSYEVFVQPKFHQQVRDQFELVMIDFPRDAENRSRVENPARNQQVAEHFGVASYPTVVLADAQGRPYGFENYVEGGVSAFVQRVREHQAVRQRRDQMLARVESAAGAAKLAPIRECAELLLESKLFPFYEELLTEWTQVALTHDRDNRQGVYELVFQCRWIGQLAQLDKEDAQGLARLAATLDNWERQCDFRDPDRGAVMHLLAGVCLLQAGEQHFADAARHFKEGAECKPLDQELALRLKALSTLGDDHLAGTGFVVSADGYVVTNHHVIEGPGAIAVQIEGQQPMPAQVVAQDPELDIALLRVSAPRGARFRPVVFGPDEVRRGQEVAAFGYPMGNPSMILTRGGVSGQSGDGFLILDCLVNPGNSGGPLCDTAGRVIGVVTAKSGNSDTVDSYGLALPVSVVRRFLERSLPGGSPQVQMRAGRTAGWEAVNDRVAPSVVMIVRSLAIGGDLGVEAIPRRDSGPSSAAESDRGSQSQSPQPVQPAPQPNNATRAPSQSPQPAERAVEPVRPAPQPRNVAPSKPHWLIPPEPGGPERFTPTGQLTALDLSKHFNAKLDEGTPKFPDNHWRELPRGAQTMAGVKFHIGDGVVQLRGGQYWMDAPEKIEIPVAKRFSNVYLLHATQVNLPSPTKVGSVTIRYRDGHYVMHPINYKHDVADGWLRWKPQPLPQAAFAWVGDNPAANRAGYRLSLYATRFVNPYPEKEVEAIVYESTSNPECAPFCVAMTIEHGTGSASTPSGGAASDRAEQAQDKISATGASAGSVKGRFIDRGEYVEDTKTGLLWQKDGEASGKMNYYQAQQYASNLRLGGQTGWRLPTREELEAIFPATERPFTDTLYAKDPKGTREMNSYWTAEMDPRVADYAYVYQWYRDGGANNCFASKNYVYVRCVHDPLKQ